MIKAKHIGLKILTVVVVCIITISLVMAFYFTKQQRNNIMEENKRISHKLMLSVQESVKTMMLEGEASIAQNFADSLKSIPSIRDFWIIRSNGLEAFRDNKTIDEVNRRIGEEEFFPRDEEHEIKVLEENDPLLIKALAGAEMIKLNQTTAENEHLLTMVAPILNTKECFSCHGSKEVPRGAVMLSVSLDQAEQAIANSWKGSIIVLSILTILAVVVMALLIRSISMPIQQVADQLKDIAQGEGNLDVSLNFKGVDEIAQLSWGFNTFVNKIRKTIVNFSGVTSNLTSMADQLAQITERSSANLTTQRQDIEGIVASVGELSTSLDEVAYSAQQGAEVSVQVDEESRKGKSEMTRTIDAMQELMNRIDSGEQTIQDLNTEMVNINEILAVIREITDQTNLLALNACIESARAGEQGRGFAVVADEVRKLADRTHTSAGEIEDRIKKLETKANLAQQSMHKSKEQAEISMKQANKSSQTLENIADASKKISEVNLLIANAVEEEKKAAEMVSVSIHNINEVAHKNSEESDQTKSRSEELAKLSDNLIQLVNQFKV